MAHDPQYVAVRQLETALRLYFEQEDYYSVITLAGASEEMLGKLLKENGIENSLDSLKKASLAITKQLFGEAPTEKEVVARANDARNRLKHGSPGKPIEFDAKEEAKDMLDRAIDNYYELTSELTDTMQRFQTMHVRDNKQPRLDPNDSSAWENAWERAVKRQ